MLAILDTIKQIIKGIFLYLKRVSTTPPLTTAYLLAADEIGVNEKQFPDRIIEYIRVTIKEGTAYIGPDTPWCAFFVNYIVSQAGLTGTYSGLARSFENWGRPVVDWRENATNGDIVVLSRTSNPRYGHVGFFAGWTDKGVRLLGGNQNDSVCFKEYDYDRIVTIRTI